MPHEPLENRNGLVVDVATTPATGKAERQAALKLLAKHARRGATVGADKGYDAAEFVAGCRRLGVTPHVARKKSGSAIDGRTTRHAGYQTSQKLRRRIEEAFGWLKTVGGLRKTHLWPGEAGRPGALDVVHAEIRQALGDGELVLQGKRQVLALLPKRQAPASVVDRQDRK